MPVDPDFLNQMQSSIKSFPGDCASILIVVSSTRREVQNEAPSEAFSTALLPKKRLSGRGRSYDQKRECEFFCENRNDSCEILDFDGTPSATFKITPKIDLATEARSVVSIIFTLVHIHSTQLLTKKLKQRTKTDYRQRNHGPLPINNQPLLLHHIYLFLHIQTTTIHSTSR
jgi:hypothetical protein